MRRPRIVLSLTAALTAAALGIPPAPALADTKPLVGGELATVTLITGDRVTVRGDRVVGVSMHASRRAVRYWQQNRNGHDYVLPMDAAKAVAEGRLDERLFDVTGLVQQGYDDKHTREVPVIVSTPPGARAALPPVARTTRQLGAVGLLGASVPKDKATEFFTAAPSTKIWLDGKVQASLDQSVPQTGAPQAWRAGYRADGVKVAVLDTGADAAHPDLAGKIDGSANFTRDPDTKDGNGHGTHVASTILGSGAASGGRYQGMAPGARLLVGKVLDNNGFGSESGIIAGMQWAAEQGARVTNLSLGSQPTDGTDPVSQALNDLSQSSGALFVVAAGNRGRDDAVNSPASADKALAVASVTKSDQLSVFSSRGPRVGDSALKPEIAGPGSDIVAARAAGTLGDVSVNESYAKLSGTSMATPHVAGAAAILAGQHPDWRADQLKATLVGSARTVDGMNAFAQGSGVVDVARAVRQQARVEPASISLTDGQSEAGEVYHNDSDKPIELAVSADLRYRNGSAAPAGLFALTGDKVVVAPKSSAKLGFRVTAKPGQSGQFVGTINATDGKIKLTTPVAVTLAGEQHTLTVRALDRQGTPNVALIAVQNEITGEVFGGVVADGVFTQRVSKGRYRVLGQVLENGWEIAAFTTFALPGTEVDKDTELAVSTADAKPVTVSVDEPTARPEPIGGSNGAVSTLTTQSGPSGTGVILGGGPTLPMYAKGSAKIPGLEFVHISQWQLPWSQVTVLGPNGYDLADTLEQSKEGWRGSITGKLVDVGDASGDPGDLTGKVPLLVTEQPPPDEELARRVRMLKDRGARIVLSSAYIDDLSILPVVQAYNRRDVNRLRQDLARGPVEVRVDGRRDSPYSYFNAASVPDQIPAGHSFRFERKSMAQVDSTMASLQPTDHFLWTFMTVTSPSVATRLEINVRWPQRRTDYYSPGFTWQGSTSIGFDPKTFQGTGFEVIAPINPKAGERRSLCLYCAPFGPEIAQLLADRQTGQPLPWAYRQGDKLSIDVPMFGSRDPGTFTFVDGTNKGTTVLYRDGREIGRNNVPGHAGFDIPGGLGRYTLVSEATKTAPEWPLSIRTKAEWTFLTAPSKDRKPLPLLDVRFNLPLDDRNTAPAGAMTGDVHIGQQPGGPQLPVAKTTVDLSFDDGATWQPARVTPDGPKWRVELPGGTGFASLRATATDVAGNSVTETMIRAYQIR